MPMLPHIEGTKGYRTALTKAAETLYRMIQTNDRVQANFGNEIILAGKSHGKLSTLSKRPKPADLLALETLLHSLAHAGSWPLVIEDGVQKRRNYVAVPMDNNAFSKEPYKALSRDAFRSMVYALAIFIPDGGEKPWLELVPSFNNRETGVGMKTRVGATTAFLDWMVRQGLIFPYHPHAKSSRKKANAPLLRVSIKDAVSGKKSAYPLDRPLKDEETILPAINEALASQRLSRPLGSYKEITDNYDFTRGKPKKALGGSKRLYRQFSGKDGIGGRLYGHWVQNLPSWLREGLTINGKPVIELDFGNMQLALLYAVSGVPVPDVDDLYEMPGMPADRDSMKMVLTLSVGNATREETLAAIRKKLHDENRTGPEKAERLYDTFWTCHEAVNPHRHDATNGAWAELQNLDSRIALRILAKLLDQNITAIPLHDSFIVARRDAENTESVMLETFEEYCPGTPVRVKIAPRRA